MGKRWEEDKRTKFYFLYFMAEEDATFSFRPKKKD